MGPGSGSQQQRQQTVRSLFAADTMLGWLVAAVVFAAVLAVGPLSSAIVNSVLIEIAIGAAAKLPVPQLLPAGLDGLGGVALIAIPVFQVTAERPDDPAERALRGYAWFVVFAALGAAIAANGAHAVFADRKGAIALPDQLAFGVSALPPISAFLALHLLMKLLSRVVTLVLRIRDRRVLIDQHADSQEDQQELQHSLSQGGSQSDSHPESGPKPRGGRRGHDPRIVRIARSGGSWRDVATATGLDKFAAQRALTAARKSLRGSQQGGIAA